MGVTSLGARPLAAALAGGRCRGEQPQAWHQVSRLVEAGEVTTLSAGRDGHDQRHATQGLEGLDPGMKAPGVHLRLKCLCHTLEAFGVCGHRAAICLKGDGLSRCVTDDGTPPPPVGWAPRGPARRATRVAEEKGVEPARGGVASAEGLFASPAAVAERFVCHRGDSDAGEGTGAPQAGALDGVAPLGVEAGARLVGQESGRDDPAHRAFGGQIAREPVPAGACVIAKDEVWGVGVQRAHELLTVGLPGTEGAKVEALGLVIVGDRGHRDGIVVDIQTDGACARVTQG
jgi:hypothetical protein